MKARLLLPIAVIATVAVADPVSGQVVRPESLSYMSRLFQLKEFSRFENPRYSHDGRWLAFDARSGTDAGQNIFVAPANGGTPVAITTGSHVDKRPMWSAGGDRLIFSSSLTGGVMTIGVDPATGRATSPARRVTIDSVVPRGFDVSPDGKSVAYITRTGTTKFDLRVAPITGGPSKTLASVDGGSEGLRFDRTGAHIYFLVQRLDGALKNGHRVRDMKRIATSGGTPATVLTIPLGMMGVQIDPLADRVVVRENERAHVLTLGGDSVATIALARGFRTVSHLAFTPDGSSMVTAFDARQLAIHVVPLDGSPIRAVTDTSGTPWPNYWVGDRIFLSGSGRGTVQDMVSANGSRSTVTFDLGKANDGGPVPVMAKEPFADGVHFVVRGLSDGGDTTLFVYNSRTGDARKVAPKVSGPRLFWSSGPGDSYSARVGDEILYNTAKNGIAEVHQLDVSGRDRIIHSAPLPKTFGMLAVAPGRTAHTYQRGDTAFLDVAIGSAKPVHVLARPGTRMGEVVFNADGSSLYAEVTTGSGENTWQHGAFFSTLDARSLASPVRWVETGTCWHPTWLPSGAGVLEFCQNSSETRTWVWRVPATGPTTPQIVTQRESALFWDYTMSPDGKHIAVPAVHNSGLDLWRVDLSAAASARRRPTRQ